MKSPIIQQQEHIWASRIHTIKPMACVTILNSEYFEGGVMVTAEITELDGERLIIPFLFANLGKIYSPKDWEGWMPDNADKLCLIDWCEGYLGYPAEVIDGHVHEL